MKAYQNHSKTTKFIWTTTEIQTKNPNTSTNKYPKNSISRDKLLNSRIKGVSEHMIKNMINCYCKSNQECGQNIIRRDQERYQIIFSKIWMVFDMIMIDFDMTLYWFYMIFWIEYDFLLLFIWFDMVKNINNYRISSQKCRTYFSFFVTHFRCSCFLYCFFLYIFHISVFPIIPIHPVYILYFCSPIILVHSVRMWAF